MSDYERGDVGLHDHGDLVSEDNAFAGAGFIESANGLKTSVDDNNAVGIGIGSAGMALETLGLALDPLGSVLTAGIGWIIEHVSVLRWPLDMLMGDPVGISAAKDAIEVEKSKLEQWSQTHQDKVAELMGEWSGEAAEQFKANMDAVSEQLLALGDYVDSAAKSMETAGAVVGAVRGVVRDLISMLLATIIKGALIAAAMAPITFGASIAMFIGTTIGAVAAALAKIGTKISNLTSQLGKLGSSVSSMVKGGDDFVAAGGAAVNSGSRVGAPMPTGGPSVRPGSGDAPTVNGGTSPSQAPSSPAPTPPPSPAPPSPSAGSPTPPAGGPSSAPAAPSTPATPVPSTPAPKPPRPELPKLQIPETGNPVQGNGPVSSVLDGGPTGGSTPPAGVSTPSTPGSDQFVTPPAVARPLARTHAVADATAVAHAIVGDRRVRDAATVAGPERPGHPAGSACGFARAAGWWWSGRHAAGFADTERPGDAAGFAGAVDGW